MATSSRPASANYQVIKSVALPSEHGAWGFLFEPILLGLMVAASVNGALLSVALLCAFLMHQPLKIAIKDRLKRRRPARTVWAERFLIGYGASALILFGIVLANADPQFMTPLLLAFPLILVQIYFDARNQSRALIPEIFGAVALGSIASAVAILGGWTLPAALWLWWLMGSRTIPSILYVRARLKLEHKKPVPPYPVWIAHGLALTGVVFLAIYDVIPALAIVPYIVLLARAVIGLSKYRKPRPAKHIGFMEIAYGLFTVVLIAMDM